MKVKRYIVNLVDDGSLAFKLSEEELLMNWNADEVEQPCEDKQDCEHCIHTYGTLGCCDMVNNEWIYDCDFGREQYRKEHGKHCEDCISRADVLGLAKKGVIVSNNNYQAVCKAINELTPVTPKARWIPITERLPEKNVEVLVTTKWDCITTGEIFDDYNSWLIYDGTTYADNDDITAWMPLPQPYKAERENQ